MFSPLNSEYREAHDKYDDGEMAKTVILALLLVFLSFIVLILLVGIGYAILIYVLKFFRHVCCVSCQQKTKFDSQPPPYDSLCNYFKFIFHFMFCYLRSNLV